MAKMIKFDLPIDGVKVATLDELRDHFTIEIIGQFRSGLLARWLRSRGWTRELAAVEALTADDDATTLKGLCQIFEVEADDDAIVAALAEATGVPGIRPRQPVVPSPDPDIILKNLLSLLFYLVTVKVKSNPILFKFKIEDFYEYYLKVSCGIAAGIVAGMAGEDVDDNNIETLYDSVIGDLTRTFEFFNFTAGKANLFSRISSRCISKGIGTCFRESTEFCPDTDLGDLISVFEGVAKEFLDDEGADDPLFFFAIHNDLKDIHDLEDLKYAISRLFIGMAAGIVAGMTDEVDMLMGDNYDIHSLNYLVPSMTEQLSEEEVSEAGMLGRLIAVGIAQAKN